MLFYHKYSFDGVHDKEAGNFISRFHTFGVPFLLKGYVMEP